MKAKFSGSPIAHPEALARALRIPLNDLRTIAGVASRKYSDFFVKKKDGSDRRVSGPQYDLKIIQKRINRVLFERVDFPQYLMGGLKGRDYVKNAQLHSGAAVVIALDIENFYPRITRRRVEEIYRHVFDLTADVSKLLADLSTKDGAVPQGACTSSYLANLAFYEAEPRFVAALKEQGLVYSRLIDDITVSSKRPMSKARVEKVIEQAAKMLKAHGFDLKQPKTRVSSKSNPENFMEVTGLWLNRGHPRLKRGERIEIRREVRACITQAGYDVFSLEYHSIHEKVSGRVSKLAQLGHAQADVLRGKLRAVLPLYDEKETRRTKGMVAGLCATPIGSRSTPKFIERFHQVMYRINVLARNRAALAKILRGKMRACAPLLKMDEAIHGS